MADLFQQRARLASQAHDRSLGDLKRQYLEGAGRNKRQHLNPKAALDLRSVDGDTFGVTNDEYGEGPAEETFRIGRTGPGEGTVNTYEPDPRNYEGEENRAKRLAHKRHYLRNKGQDVSSLAFWDDRDIDERVSNEELTQQGRGQSALAENLVADAKAKG